MGFTITIKWITKRGKCRRVNLNSLTTSTLVAALFTLKQLHGIIQQHSRKQTAG